VLETLDAAALRRWAAGGLAALRELITEPLLHGLREQLPNRFNRANTNRLVRRRNGAA
jgi:hypothetical protein